MQRYNKRSWGIISGECKNGELNIVIVKNCKKKVMNNSYLWKEVFQRIKLKSTEKLKTDQCNFDLYSLGKTLVQCFFLIDKII